MHTAARHHRNDRFFVALLFALLAHGLLLIIQFGYSPPEAASNSLEITLANYRSDKAPDKADYLAQANQQGSGDAPQKRAPATNKPALFEDNVVKEVKPEAHAGSHSKQPKASRILTTKGKTDQKTQRVTQDKQDISADNPESQLSLWQRSLEIASLEAQLREQQETSAKGPRKRQLTSASTKETRDAYYLDGWRQKIEMVGNLNYPAEARKRQLYGELRMLVAVKSNGAIHEVRILKSSGKKILDDAAVRIVQLAAPFQAFPPEIRRDTDILEIVRTWRFERGDTLSAF